ncbi:xylulokinase [Tengunoibacter tsumagoiensis]|uniref:Xylulose kinase n=1 Tax=Tengunoibacter tsumagoiensis TaxID=2014871 RepID=A0A401ZZL9_9CHLR|nr:xylulokinase [Tengunoibacter tsumagoiensis]GCE12289.1 xylulokinase [Tengunoibacter tsumagoiensis]
MQTLLGLDLGTTGVKAALFAVEDGHVVADAFYEYPLFHPHPGWAEQNPQDWWQATLAAIRSCLEKAEKQGVKPADVKGLGLSGQMHGVVLLDEADQVLRPCIIWADQRSEAQCQWMTERVGASKLIEYVSNPALTGFTAPKLLWVRDNEPALFARARTLLLPKDYIRYLLTGVKAMEISDAAGTCLLDVKHGVWSQEVLKAIELDPAILPPVVPADAASGSINAEVAHLTGLPVGVPVAGGGADNACGAVGNGVVVPGLALVSVGTSGIVLSYAETPQVDTSGPVPRVHTFNHAAPDAWYLMGVTQGAGLSMRWLRDNIGLPERALERWTGGDAYDYLAQEAAGVPAGSEGLIFLPYLQGERTPHLDAYARGGWIGLTASHDRRHLIRSVMEGVAFSLKDCFSIIQEQGLRLEQVRATGGGAKSPLWRQIIADILGVELVVTNASEGPAFGAALLAGVAAGVYPSVQVACEKTVRVLEKTEPDQNVASAYQQAYETYRALYPALKPIISRPGAF